MVTWSICDKVRYYENEVYHDLNKGLYLVNARVTIKDERSYRLLEQRHLGLIILIFQLDKFQKCYVSQ